MTDEEILELVSDWFDSIEKISTREDISNEDKLLRIEATCQRCNNFLDKRKQKDNSKRMNNEKKAQEIANDYYFEYPNETFEYVTSKGECYKSALEMAKLKDQQFKELLYKWLNDDGKIDVIKCNIEDLIREIDNHD